MLADDEAQMLHRTYASDDRRAQDRGATILVAVARAHVAFGIAKGDEDGGVDRALLSFDVQADLTPAFHWNLKQLFVFVLAEYQTPKNELNQVILWDRIVETEEQAKLDERNIYVKYALIDQANELRNTSINYFLVWDHMPVTGRLFMDKGFGSKKILPKEYF